MPLPILDRALIIEQTKTLWKKVYSSTGAYEASCLQVSMCLMAVLTKYDPECEHYFQAGTAQWRTVLDENDDGVSMTHFGYVFDANIAWKMAAMGILPEIHCWVVRVDKDRSSPEIIDMLWGSQPIQMTEMTGRTDVDIPLTWDTKLLPDQECLWIDANENAARVQGNHQYHASHDAIDIALLFASKLPRPVFVK